MRHVALDSMASWVIVLIVSLIIGVGLSDPVQRFSEKAVKHVNAFEMGLLGFVVESNKVVERSAELGSVAPSKHWVIREELHKVLRPIALMLACFSLMLLPLARLKRQLGMLDVEAIDLFISRNYYASRCVVGRKLEQRDPQNSTLAFAATPLEFALNHQLLEPSSLYGNLEDTRSRVKFVQSNKAVVSGFDRLKAARVFASQLGPPLLGRDSIKALPKEYRALLLVLIQECVQRQTSTKQSTHFWLSQFSTSFWDEKVLRAKQYESLPKICVEKLNTSGVDNALSSVLAKLQNNSWIFQIEFANLLMMKLMRKSSLTTAEFLWLKVVNRTLFYTLNNVGRARRKYVEGLGAFVHERYGSCKLPQVSDAVDSLKNTLIQQGILAPKSKI